MIALRPWPRWAGEVTLADWARVRPVVEAVKSGFTPAEQGRHLAAAMLGVHPERIWWLSGAPSFAPAGPVSSIYRYPWGWSARPARWARAYRRPANAIYEPVGKHVLLEDLKLDQGTRADELAKAHPERLAQLCAVLTEPGNWADREALNSGLKARTAEMMGLPLSLALGMAEHFMLGRAQLRRLNPALYTVTGGSEPEQAQLVKEFKLHYILEGYRARKGLKTHEVYAMPSAEVFSDLAMFAREGQLHRIMQERLSSEAKRRA